ncbi:MAG: RNA-directed DNA polymerase, partial [Bryobacteraceae bacterium]
MRRRPHTSVKRELAAGADGTRAETFEAGLAQNLREISRRIHRTDQDGLPSYRFGRLLLFEHSKEGGVSRNIYVARIRDQLVLRVMSDVVCAAAQKRWGTSLKPPKPVEMIDSFRRDVATISCPFVLRTDIQAFFGSVPRDRVAEQAASLIDEPITRSLLFRWSEHIIAGPAWHSGRECDFPVAGLPPGVSLSSCLAELYLANLDGQAQKRFHWFRYVDDILVLCKSETEAQAAHEWVRGALENLGLSISMPKTNIARLQDGVSWLGLKHFDAETRADPMRVRRWLKRFVTMKRRAAEQIRVGADPESRVATVTEFHRNLRREIRGVGNSRPHWYSRVSDHGLWKQLD